MATLQIENRVLYDVPELSEKIGQASILSGPTFGKAS